MKPRWLRHITASVRPSVSPWPARPRASALVRRSSSAKVTIPSSSMTAGAAGKRAAPPTTPAAIVGPKRCRPMIARIARSGREGRNIPARASVPATWMPSERATAIAGIQSWSRL